MKPLTIDELKALKVGDWVWVEYDTYYVQGGYVRICAIDDKALTISHTIPSTNYPFSDYGTKWVAYKNKEQAECKGEIVELRCKVGDEVFYVCGGNIETYIVEMVGCDQEGWYFTVDDEDHFEHYFDDESIIGVTVFFERDKAEAKLKELQGKHE